jgi:hypothetical protein
LAIASRIARRSPFRRLRYVADQVNHNQLTPDSRLLQDPRVRILFLLRHPEPTIASILELYRTHYGQAWSPPQAVDYYVERLATLIELGESLASPVCAALIPYETLMDLPQETLEALRLFLGLGQGFTQNYITYSFTGKHGDPGPNISAGRIIHKAPTARADLNVTELERARRAYDRCRSALARFALRV